MRHHIQLDLEIAFSSHWRAGSGEGSLTTDRLIRRNARQQPFIPASTLKGIIRQSCEKLSRTRGFVAPSDPHQPDLTPIQSGALDDPLVSPVDRLFGAKHEPGGLFFRDAHLKTNEAEAIAPLVRTRTARYRVLQTAKDQQLFSTEYAPAALFCSKIDGWHHDLACLGAGYPPYEYCLLIASVLAVERIGGDKSIGAGWLNGAIGLQKAMVNGDPIDLDDIFEYLDPQDYSETLSDMRGES